MEPQPQLYWHKYNKGLWWVAKEAINPPEDVTSRKRKPAIVVVTYFSEPKSFVAVTNPAEIVKYDADKESYIRKGLQFLQKSKSSQAEDWKEDVREAEKSINGEPNIIERIEKEEQQNVKPKKSIVAEIFGTPKPKTVPSVPASATPAKTPGRRGRPPLQSSAPKKTQVTTEKVETQRGSLNCTKCLGFYTDNINILITHMKLCQYPPAKKVPKPRTPRKSTPKTEIPRASNESAEGTPIKKQRGRPRKSAETPVNKQMKASGSKGAVSEPTNNDTSLKMDVMDDWKDEEDDETPKIAKPDPSSMFDKLSLQLQTQTADSQADIDEVEESGPDVTKGSADVDVKPAVDVSDEDDDMTAKYVEPTVGDSDEEDDMTAKFKEIMESTEPVKSTPSDVLIDSKSEEDSDLCTLPQAAQNETAAGNLDGANTLGSSTEEAFESSKTPAATGIPTRKRRRLSAPKEQVTSNRRSSRFATEEPCEELQLPPPTRRRRGPPRSGSQPEIVPAAPVDIPQKKVDTPPEVASSRGTRSSKLTAPVSTKEISSPIPARTASHVPEETRIENRAQESEAVEGSQSTKRVGRGRRPSNTPVRNEPQLPRRSRRSSKVDSSAENQAPSLKTEGPRDESSENHVGVLEGVSGNQNSEKLLLDQTSQDLLKEPETVETFRDSSTIRNETEAVSHLPELEQTEMPIDEKVLVEEAVVEESQLALEGEHEGEILTEEIKVEVDQKAKDVIFAKKTLPKEDEEIGMEVDISETILNGHPSTPERRVSDIIQKNETVTSSSKPDHETLLKVGSKRKQSFGDLSSGYGQIELKGPTPPKQRTLLDRRGSKELVPVVEEPKVIENTESEDNLEGQATTVEENVDEVTIPAGEYDGKVVHVVPVEDEDGSITYMVYALDQEQDEPQEPMHAIYIEEGKNLDLNTIMESLQAAPGEVVDSQSDVPSIPDKHVEIKTEKEEVTGSSTNENSSGIQTVQHSTNSLHEVDTDTPAQMDTSSAVVATEK